MYRVYFLFQQDVAEAVALLDMRVFNMARVAKKGRRDMEMMDISVADRRARNQQKMVGTCCDLILKR